MWKGQRGLVDLIVMLGLLSVVSMGLMASLLQRKAINANADTKLAIDIYQQNLTAYLQDEDAWKNTLEDTANYSFQCIHAGTNCEKIAKPIMIVRNSNNEIMADSNAGRGVRVDGTLCNVSDGDCHFRVAVTWKPICDVSCVNPRVIEINVAINNASVGSQSTKFIASSALGIVRKPTSIPKASVVGVGFRHTCAIAEGAVYCWGYNDQGQLGQPLATALSNRPLKVVGLESGVTGLSVGYNHNCAIQNGGAKCWGENVFFQSGAWAPAAADSPRTIYNGVTGLALSNVEIVSAGATHSCAVANGAAYCWGANGSGKLGTVEDAGLLQDPFSGQSALAMPVLDLNANVTSISSGLDHTCAVVAGALKCWGTNDARGGNNNASLWGFRLLGVNPPHGSYKVCWPHYIEGTVLPGPDPMNPSVSSNPAIFDGFFSPTGPLTIDQRVNRCQPRPVEVIASGVRSVAAAGLTTCVVMDTGNLKCWGQNYGALAQGTYNPVASEALLDVPPFGEVTAIGRTNNRFCGIVNSRLYCWGMNSSENALGTPTVNNGALGVVWPTPIQINIPGTVTNFGGGGIDQNSHHCAVADEKVYCFGQNTYGQLGDGTFVDKSNGTPAVVIKW